MSSSDIGKLTLAESWYQNASQNIGTLFNCPWFQVRLDVKFIGLCKSLNFMERSRMKIRDFVLYPLSLLVFGGEAALSKGVMRIF